MVTLTLGTYSGMPPKVYECVDVGGWSEKKVVPPLIVANVQAAVLVHPVDKPHDMEDCGLNLSSTDVAQLIPYKTDDSVDSSEPT